MAFIVMYERTDGTLAAESCDDLEAAVAAAERLRNVDSIERPRIYETNEIQYDFQPYFRVQVAGAAAAGASTVFADGDPAQGADSATADSAAADGVDWPSHEASSDDASGAATETADAADGEVDTAVADGEVSPVEAVEADLASVEEAEAGIEAPEADESYVSDLDVLNVDEQAVDSDIDLTEGAGDAAEGGQKQGLFDKFVKTLEGDAAEGAADQVDDLGSTESSSRRGLFGR